MSFTIASAAVADAPQCAALLVAQLAEHNVQVTPHQLLPVLNQVIADPTLGFLLAAREEDHIIGVAYAATFLSAEHCGFVASLEELYVAPEHRARGVGTAFLSDIVERASISGIVAIVLEVDAGHSRAIPLYQRFGFQRMDRSRWCLKLQT